MRGDFGRFREEGGREEESRSLTFLRSWVGHIFELHGPRRLASGHGPRALSPNPDLFRARGHLLGVVARSRPRSSSSSCPFLLIYPSLHPSPLSLHLSPASLSFIPLLPRALPQPAGRAEEGGTGLDTPAEGDRILEVPRHSFHHRSSNPHVEKSASKLNRLELSFVACTWQALRST